MTPTPDERSRSACPDENTLALLAEGGIERGARVALEHHLDGCAACSRLVAELAQLAVPARAAPERYQIIRQLGAGAMGIVWEAEDTALARKVALKFVRPEGGRDRERRARLMREARALGRLRHPNVLAVHDVGTAGTDELFLALELVVGTNAREWRSGAPRSASDILALWRKVGAGLSAVHQAGIIHRDVKPDNVLVANDGRVLISDFGLATGELVDTTTILTRTGAVVGTPLYMAPEQLRGSPVTAKSDQFALCVCMWEALSGERPFHGASVGALAIAMLTPPRLPPGADRHVFEVLGRGLAFDPASRWPTIDALDAALAAAVARRTRSRRWLAYGAAAIVPATVVVGVALFAGARAIHGPTDTDPGGDRAASVPGDASTPVTNPAPDALRPRPADHAPRPPASAHGDARPDGSAGTGGGGGAAERRVDAAGRVAPVARTDGAGQVAPVARAAIEAPASPLRGASARSAAGIRGAPAAIPSAPPEEHAAWVQTLQRATNHLAADDARGCLTELATIAPVPTDRADDAEQLRAACVMAAGDCAGGRTAYESYARSRGKSADAIARDVDALDLAHCAIDAPPQAKWAARARIRLGTLLAGQGSCKPVLDVIVRRNIVMENPQEYEIERVACLARDHDCAGARAAWRAINVPASTPPGEVAHLEQMADQSLVKVAPGCVGAR